MRFALVLLLVALLASVAPSAGAYYDPNRPATLVAVQGLDGSNYLAWSPVPGAAAYVIYRGLDPRSMEPVATTDGVFWQDTTAPPGAVYHYGVKVLGSSADVEPIVTESRSECIGVSRNLTVSVTVQNCIKW